MLYGFISTSLFILKQYVIHIIYFDVSFNNYIRISQVSAGISKERDVAGPVRPTTTLAKIISI